MTATLSPTIAALCRALDAGDDSVLPVLADALADEGDHRAEGLRRLCVGPAGIPVSPTGYADGAGRRWFSWARAAGEAAFPSHGPLPGVLFDRLRGGEMEDPAPGWVLVSRAYPTRSAALLALAESLAQEPSPVGQ